LITTNAASIPVTDLSHAMFTSVANGFAIIHSDGAGASATQNADITLTTAVDLASLSSFTNFTLKFEHTYRTFEDAREIRVSGDNGSTWETYVITTTSNAEANQNTGNPDVYSVNITNAVAPGGVTSSQVLIQFHYEGNFGWYWAIDDVAIVETDNDDVRVDEYFTADINNDFQYSQIPLSQVRPLSMGLTVTNIGVNDQDVSIDYDIQVGGSSVEAGNSAVTTITSIMTDTLFHTTTYTPAAVGLHTLDLTASVTTDTDPTNNS